MEFVKTFLNFLLSIGKSIAIKKGYDRIKTFTGVSGTIRDNICKKMRG